MTKFLIGNLALVAEFERDLIRDRIASVMSRREDGRIYGPRSDRPVGRPSEYGEGHKFRTRNGHRTHDKAHCRLCRGEMAGPDGLRVGTGRRGGR